MPTFDTWFRSRLGTEQGRVIPTTFEAPDGTYVYALGSEIPGQHVPMREGAYSEITQELTEPAKIVRFRGIIRGPSRMAIVSTDEVFALSDGDTLDLLIDRETVRSITFDTADFDDIANARGWEVANAINAQATAEVLAKVDIDRIAVTSKKAGKNSRVEVTGGTAAATLGFVELAWKASLYAAGSEVSSFYIEPGDERDLSTMIVNTALLTPPFDLTFRLDLVTR